LLDYCNSSERSPKQTYVWMCCFCIDQHSVVEQMKGSGILTRSKVDFFLEFGSRVTGIGHVLAMMSPWKDPGYLKRIWCVFEFFSANQYGCKVTIVMPPAEKTALERDLLGDEEGEGIDNLYEALARTKVQDAKASVASDGVAILNQVKNDPGYEILNQRVNELLRKWVRTAVLAVGERQRDSANALAYADICTKVGQVLSSNGEYDIAMLQFGRALAIREALLSGDHPDVAESFYMAGSARQDMGDYEGALLYYKNASFILENAGGVSYSSCAATYNSIGSCLLEKGDLDGALAEHRKALAVYKEALGNNHPDLASALTNIGTVLHAKGEFVDALLEHKKGLNIRLSALGTSHPDTSSSYYHIATVFRDMGHLDSALLAYRRALEIQERVLGRDHPETSYTYNNIGMALQQQGKHEAALEEYRKGLAIREATLGDHPSTANSHVNIGAILLEKKDDQAALAEFQKALSIRKITLGIDHPDTVQTEKSIAELLFKKVENEPKK